MKWAFGFFALFIFTVSFNSFAGSCSAPQTFDVDVTLPSSITVTGNESANTVLWTVDTAESWRSDVTCSGGAPYNYYEGWDSYMELSALGNSIYKTNIPGVGVRVRFNFNYATKNADYPASLVYQANSSPTGWQGAPQTIELISLGTGISSGTVTFPSFSFLAENFKVKTVKFSNSAIGRIEIIAKNPGCTANSTTDFNISLDDINASQLPSVGSTSGDKEIKIGLSCKKETIVKLSLTATAVSGLDNSGVVASTGTAGGVGIQVIKDGSAFPLNGLASQVKTIGGSDIDIDIPLSVRYYRTGPVTSGNVSSIINYTISYE